MSLIVYLSNKQLQVAIGNKGKKSFSIDKCFSMDAPEGSIINGIIMDSESFVSFLKEKWAANHLPYKDVCLVINSTKFAGKMIDIPSLNEKNTIKFIEREFADIVTDEKRICSYTVLSSKGKNKKIYAESVVMEYISDILGIFNEAGIEVGSIVSGESSVINSTMYTVARKASTFVLQIADGMTLVTLLWVNGSFYYFNSARCFNEKGTEAYASDIARSVSQIKQFMQAHQIEYPLEKVFFAGVEQRDIPLYSEYLQMQGIKATAELVSLDQSFRSDKVALFQNYQFAISGLFMTEKSENFLEQYNFNNKKHTVTIFEKHKKIILPIAITFFVMLIFFMISFIIRIGKERELKQLTDYNENPANQLSVSLFDVAAVNNNELTAKYNVIKGIEDNIYTYPVCNEEIIDKIYSCAKGYAEIDVEAFDASSGQVTVSASSKEVDSINQFIKNLLKEEIFSNVDYTGYSFDSNNELWDIYVICTLSESAGRKVR